MTTAMIEQPPIFSNARHPELAKFLFAHAIKRGTFVLSSGQTSSYYCDAKLATFSGEGAELIADSICDEIDGLNADAVGGMDMGATPIMSVVALRLHQLGIDMPSFTVRKDRKGHGTKKKVEGLLPAKAGGRVVIVDDVVTTGKSICDAIDAVRAHGHDAILAISVLDREAGADERLRTMGGPYRPLVTISELGIANSTGTASGHRSAGSLPRRNH